MRNHRRAGLAALTAVLLLASLVGIAGAQEQPGETEDQQGATTSVAQLPAAATVASGKPGSLKMFGATVDAATLQELVNLGYDVTPVDFSLEGAEVALVLSPGERQVLEAKGLELTLQSNPKEGRDQQADVAATSIFGWDVYRSYDEPGGIADQLQTIASDPRNRGFVKLYDIGNTVQGRDIWAIRMTQGVAGLRLGKRPAVLYQGTTHAREWISTEVPMRLLEWFVAERRAENPEVVDILETTELWFVPVVNPDGYEYTFTTERLWRKNLQDNDDNDIINNADGVDVNRNYPEHWNWENERSSPVPSNDTYRGETPGSEPETQSNMHLVEAMAKFKFAVSYHSFGQLLLYTQGWQTLTPSADDPIYVALSGTDDDPAIADFNPGVGADLYTTNGEFTDWAHATEGVLGWTPELSEGCEGEPGCNNGFEFPDDEAKVQAEFERNLDFALNVARSAGDPDDPASHTGLDTAGLYVNTGEIDPWKSSWPTSDLRVQISYAGGSSQPVEVLAKRDLGAVTLHYTINDGDEQTAPTSESPDGEVFGGNNASNVYYHYLRGQIPGLAVDDAVEYWFSAGGESTDPVEFAVVEDADADVLIVAAEDRTGLSQIPAYPSTVSPNYLSYYEDAVTASGRTFDVYDIDANGRTSPDHLGVLGHYDTVVWYTGNDLVTREPGWSGGNVSRLAVDNTLNMRQYLNGGGTLLYAGQWAGWLENSGQQQFYDPVSNQRCVGPAVPPEVADRCLLWGDKNDFIQYYLGAFSFNSGGGFDGSTGDPFPLGATDTPYTGGGPWTFNGSDSAGNHVGGAGLNPTASFLTTSTVLPRNEYPQFTSDARANWNRPGTGGNPFAPFDGSWYVYSQQADISYKRLGRTFTVPADGGEMTFRFSYDTEHDWDFVFVEAHTLDETPDDDWTTLEDLNGHNSQSTGPNDPDLASCPAGWHELHPHLARYQTWDGSGACTPIGTTGEWWANSGRSAGWESWRLDLTPYAGKTIEIFISYASDWAVQGLGSFIDSVQMPGEAVESFETPTEDWAVTGPPDGSDPNLNDWVRSEDLGFEEGGIVSETPPGVGFATLYFGFGLEGVDGAVARADLMDRSLDFLGT